MKVNLHQTCAFKPREETNFVGGLKLATGRVHEFCGISRRLLALIWAGLLCGPVIWIHSKRQKISLNTDGIQAYMNPGRLVMVSPSTTTDILWSMEEALRSGVAGLVVADLFDVPAMVPVRRLHLAAQTGMDTLGVILTPHHGGAPGVESRWHFSPRHQSDATCWHLERRHARGAAPMAWNMTQDVSGFNLSAGEMDGTRIRHNSSKAMNAC